MNKIMSSISKLSLISNLTQDTETLSANLKRNWFFPISALAFFCLETDIFLEEYIVNILFAFVISLIIASQIPSILNYIQINSRGIQIFSALTSIGICMEGLINSIITWYRISEAILSFFFIYVCVSAFWKKMYNIFKNTSPFQGLKSAEIIVYTILLLSTLCFITIVFMRTDAFYGTEFKYDIIYTSDSPYLVKSNVYLVLSNPDNDIRQPLFAVFAAPFIGLPFLIGKLLSFPALIMNYAQVILLFFSNYLLTKIMKLSPMKRACFMLLSCCSYTYLLFSLMMEQYIVAYFWLIFFLYLYCENDKSQSFALWGAGGTLLTSMILLPLITKKSLFKNFREWLLDVINCGIEFVVLILAFCRFDVFFNLATQIFYLSSFTGENITFIDKFSQYTEFIRNSFCAPNAGIDYAAMGHISWQLNAVTAINPIGVIILVLVIVSALLNKDKKSSLLSIGWFAFSFFMLCIVGWGTVENGLILYSLYFSWPFFVLLFQLVEKIEDKLNIKFLIPLTSTICSLIILTLNIPAMKELLDFAITNFPL